jgi:hypothetical protein
MTFFSRYRTLIAPHLNQLKYKLIHKIRHISRCSLEHTQSTLCGSIRWTTFWITCTLVFLPFYAIFGLNMQKIPAHTPRLSFNPCISKKNCFATPLLVNLNKGPWLDFLVMCHVFIRVAKIIRLPTCWLINKLSG